MASNLRVDQILPSTSTNVAIGTATGSVTLVGSVSGTSITNSGVTTVAAGSASAPSITPTGDSNTGIFFPSADTIAFAEGGTEISRFDSSGRLGIGTVNPSSRVHVYNGDVSITGPVNSNANLYLFNNAASSNAFRIGQGWSGNDNVGFLLNVANADIVFGTNNAENARLTSAGNIQISNGNLVFSTAGTGIDFSATANSSGTMTSELLNDYETGTWTPVYRQGGSGGTAFTVSGGTQYARYIKVGKIVLVNFGFTNSTVSGSANSMYITGLPFTMWSNGSNNLRNIGTPILYIGGFNTTDRVTLFAENTYMLVLGQGNTGWSLPTYTPTSGSYFHVSFTYEAET